VARAAPFVPDELVSLGHKGVEGLFREILVAEEVNE
jgi:hypothetical protein